MISPVFSDQDNTIHGEFLPSQRGLHLLSERSECLSLGTLSGPIRFPEADGKSSCIAVWPVIGGGIAPASHYRDQPTSLAIGPGTQSPFVSRLA